MKNESLKRRVEVLEYIIRTQDHRIALLENEGEIVPTNQQKEQNKLALTNDPVIKHFQQIVKHPPVRQEGIPLVEESEWQALQNTMGQNYPTLYTRLHENEKLSESDYRMCLLILAGFSPSAIALLMEKANASISTSRKRLLLKVFGKEGKPAEFDYRLRLFLV